MEFMRSEWKLLTLDATNPPNGIICIFVDRKSENRRKFVLGSPLTTRDPVAERYCFRWDSIWKYIWSSRHLSRVQGPLTSIFDIMHRNIVVRFEQSSNGRNKYNHPYYRWFATNGLALVVVGNSVLRPFSRESLRINLSIGGTGVSSQSRSKKFLEINHIFSDEKIDCPKNNTRVFYCLAICLPSCLSDSGLLMILSLENHISSVCTLRWKHV